MEITSAFVPSPAAGEAATLFVVLELSKARWLVAIHSPRADKISRHTIKGGDAPALLNLIGRMRDQAQHHLGTPVRVVSCFEAGYDGFWLHRALVAHGIENHVMDPASLPVDRRARRVKTDRLDLGLLMRALMPGAGASPRSAVWSACRHPRRRIAVAEAESVSGWSTSASSTSGGSRVC